MGHRRYAIVEAPSVLGLKPTGVDQLPEALLRHGLAGRLQARRTTPLVPPAYNPEVDPATRTLNAEAIAHLSRADLDGFLSMSTPTAWMMPSCRPSTTASPVD